MKVAETKAEAKAEIDLVKELTGEIIRRAEANGWTRKELAQRAKKNSAVTLYAWRNGTRKNPSLLDLQAFAAAVGMNVRLLADSAYVADGSKNLGPEAMRLKAETMDVVKVMEGASDELRAAIKDKILAMVTERASHPLDADAEQAGHRVRSSKS